MARRAKVTEDDLAMSSDDPLAESETATQESPDGVASGWEAPSTETPPTVVCVRHRWQGGNTCVRCGTSKSSTSKKTPGTGVARTRSIPRSTQLEGFIGTAWMALGVVTERYVPKPPGPPMGRILQLEATIAGPKVAAALKHTPIYPWLVRATVGPWAELMPLIVPPLIVGAVSMNPQLMERVRPLLLSMILPIVVENMKKAEEQSALIQMMGDVTDQHYQIASSLIDSIFATDDDSDSRD